MAHQVTHLATGETFTRPRSLTNTLQQPRNWKHETEPAIEAFHKTLPSYAETPLHSLPSIATELGFRHVFIKDESTRFGLPAFKILGASWAVQRAVCQRLGLPKTTSLEEARKALAAQANGAAHGERLRLVTTTEGNWGRACARMAKYLGLPCKIFVPGLMPAATRDLLRGEGAEVVPLEEGTYDDCIAALRTEAAEEKGALMVMDTSWEGFEECGQWVTEGYSTMLSETSRQITAQTGLANPPILALVSVGVGSWAQSVTSFYRSQPAGSNTTPNKVVSVEPTTAPCFKECLHQGTITPIKTGETIMNGMNCGTTSLIAWPVLRDGVDAAVTVGDREAHEDVGFLEAMGVDAGPCGAATLAGLRAVCREADGGLEFGLGRQEREGMVVVLFSTEGGREYAVLEEQD